jgi:hypothetical protein
MLHARFPQKEIAMPLPFRAAVPPTLPHIESVNTVPHIESVNTVPHIESVN